jgi:hypothetical protein
MRARRDLFGRRIALCHEITRTSFMSNALKAVLPSVETFARMAKSAPAKKNLMMQIGQIKEALRAAEQAGPPCLD